MPKSTTKQEGEKQFSLKQIEENVLANINARHNAELVDFLTFVALERLAYSVTEQTQFRVEDGHIYISERPVEETKEQEVELA